MGRKAIIKRIPLPQRCRQTFWALTHLSNVLRIHRQPSKYCLSFCGWQKTLAEAIAMNATRLMVKCSFFFPGWKETVSSFQFHSWSFMLSVALPSLLLSRYPPPPRLLLCLVAGSMITLSSFKIGSILGLLMLVYPTEIQQLKPSPLLVRNCSLFSQVRRMLAGREGWECLQQLLFAGHNCCYTKGLLLDFQL